MKGGEQITPLENRSFGVEWPFFMARSCWMAKSCLMARSWGCVVENRAVVRRVGRVKRSA